MKLKIVKQKRETQADRILRHLQIYGDATNIELNDMGIFRYAARIHDLRRKGYRIRSVPEHGGTWRFVYEGRKSE